MSWARQNQWIVLAVASGACAAFNGVFAKLTTTDLTTSFSQGIARVLHLGSLENIIEYIVRGIFFGLNLLFNGVMWTFFTRALAKGSSTTQVSIINTSSNFMITAVLGLIIFSESLPPLWWAGAALLVVGNVIIGSKDEGSNGPVAEAAPVPSANVDGLGAYEDVPQIDDVPDNALKDEDEDAVEDIMELGVLEEEH
ncbi:hypothetical protein BD289DRAFT_373653 [Coniella lustricola]|uniref:EamA domain-containing protein n=1 Tax=Coniella lustricola TaxID=2025994 RepID=A0A2T3A0S5_9PEZI|nr:hypothetical protein BD289DRAFT_373653 [Coniella lustricola]